MLAGTIHAPPPPSHHLTKALNSHSPLGNRPRQCRQDDDAVPAAPGPGGGHQSHRRQQRGAGQAPQPDLRGAVWANPSPDTNLTAKPKLTFNKCASALSSSVCRGLWPRLRVEAHSSAELSLQPVRQCDLKAAVCHGLSSAALGPSSDYWKEMELHMHRRHFLRSTAIPSSWSGDYLATRHTVAPTLSKWSRRVHSQRLYRGGMNHSRRAETSRCMTWLFVSPLQIWDLGGQANLRPSWATYYQNTDCIIMVCAGCPLTRLMLQSIQAVQRATL